VDGGFLAALTQFGGTGAQLAGQYYSQKRQLGENKRAAARQLANAEYLARHGPSWAVQGLKDAGLNPILAAGGGLKAGSAGAVPMSGQLPAVGAGLGSSAGQLATAALDYKRTKADADNARTEADAAEVPYGDDTDPRAQTNAAIERRSRIDANATRAHLNDQQRWQSAANTEYLQRQSELTEIRTQLEALGIHSAKAEADMWKSIGQGGKWLNLIRPLLPIPRLSRSRRDVNIKTGE